MSKVTGEKTWSSVHGGAGPTKREFPPLPPSTYSMKLVTQGAEIKKKPEPGKFPYINFSMEALDTGTDGGKNARVWHMLFTSLKPGKDGSQMPMRVDQLRGLELAVGQPCPAGVVEMADEEGNTVEVIDPVKLKAWLVSLDGTVIKARTKIQKGDAGYPDKTVVSAFIESEDGVAAPDSFDADDAFGSEDADSVPASTEAANDETEEEAEFEPVPPPSKKAPAKPAAKPAAKAAGKKR